MNRLQILAPIDLGDSWLKDQSWEKLKESLSESGWQAYDFSEHLQLDLSFFRYYQWMIKEITEVNEENLDEIEIAERGVEGIRECHLFLCNTGIILLKITYGLDDQISPSKAQQLYNKLSRRHFRQLFKSVVNSFKKVEQPKLPVQEDDMFKRKLIYMEEGIPHWTHGILVNATGSESELYSNQELQQFSLAETYYDYIVGDEITRCSIGWEMTAISTTGPIDNKGLIKLIWVVGFLWEEMYIFENLTITKVNNLEKGIKNIRSKLAQARRFRTVVTTVIASAAPASLTMVDRYIRILEILMDQWRIAERKESLTGKIGLLELMYSNMKDEESEYNASIFNLYVLLLTIVNGIASVGVIIEYITGSNKFSSFFKLIWFGSVVAFLILLYGSSKYFEKKNFQ